MQPTRIGHFEIARIADYQGPFFSPGEFFPDFDPAVVEVYLKIPNELWLELRSEITGQNHRFSTFDIPQPLSAPKA